jgi:hypothetical protein
MHFRKIAVDLLDAHLTQYGTGTSIREHTAGSNAWNKLSASAHRYFRTRSAAGSPSNNGLCRDPHLPQRGSLARMPQ